MSLERSQITRMLETVAHRTLVEQAASDVAKTIRQQIMAADYWALGRWGSNGYAVIGGGINDSLGEMKTGSGLDWKVKGSKFRGNVRVCLDRASDTYTIYLYTTRSYTLKIVKKLEDVYVDRLAEILEELIG